MSVEQGRDLGRKGLPPCGVRFLSNPERAVVYGLESFEIWDLQSGEVARELRLGTGSDAPYAWAVMPEEDQLIVVEGDGGPRVLDLDGTDVVRCRLPSDAEVFLGGETSGLASFGATTHPDGTYEDLGTLYRPYSKACSIAVSSGGDAALVAYGQAYALFWDLEAASLGYLLGHQKTGEELDRIYRVALSPDGQLAATLHSETGLRIWELPAGKEVARVGLAAPTAVGSSSRGDRPRDMPLALATGGGMGALAFSPDSASIAVADGARVRRYDLKTGNEMAVWVGHKSLHPILSEYLDMPRIHDIRFSGDGRRGLTVGVDSWLRVWDVESGRELWKTRPDPCCVDWADLASDGRSAIWVGCPGLRLFNVH